MEKLYYSISEVSKEVDEETHILRYWEKEFSQLNPRKNSGGNRIYSTNDLDVVRNIKSLIRNEKLSLKGAKERMDSIYSNKSDDMPKEMNGRTELNISKNELIELKNILSEVSEMLKK
jgi:DNA-binding transcriptional MerR regulator